MGNLILKLVAAAAVALAVMTLAVGALLPAVLLSVLAGMFIREYLRMVVNEVDEMSSRRLE